MVNNFFIYYTTGLTSIYKKFLKNEYDNMCHMLIFVKSKNNYFETFFRRTLLTFLKSFRAPLTIKVRGMIFLMSRP